jgi:heptosyltransferase-2
MRKGPNDSNLSRAERVLIVRLDEAGDVVLTSPFLRELRRNLPDAWITLIVKPAVYNLVELCPYVDEVLTFDWKVSRYLGPLQRHWRALRLAYRHLWHRRFDLVIVPRWDADYYHASFVAYFSGAPSRVGYSDNVIDHKRRLNGGLDKLFTHVLDNKVLKHEVQHNLEVIRSLGGKVEEDRLEIWLSPDDAHAAVRLLELHGFQPTNLLIAVGVGKRDPKRRWPIERFVELGDWLIRRYEAYILLVGEKAEKPLYDVLQHSLGKRVINTVGQTTLRQACALLKHCHLYIGNDYGPKHMAAAVGVPVIEINGHPVNGSPVSSDSPMRFGPWGVPHIVLQPRAANDSCSAGCIASDAHCILGITVDQVKEAAVSCMSQFSGND